MLGTGVDAAVIVLKAPLTEPVVPVLPIGTHAPFPSPEAFPHDDGQQQDEV